MSNPSPILGLVLRSRGRGRDCDYSWPGMTRIVHCPGCKELLIEPTAGVAIYQCGNCFMVLLAKHARSSLMNDQDAAAAAADAALAGSPGPLYKQREQQQLLPVPPPPPTTRAPFYGDKSPPLYTPRNGNGTVSAWNGNGNGNVSARNGNSNSTTSAAAAAASPPGADEENCSVLLQDMRKLAREAFPAAVIARQDQAEDGMKNSRQRSSGIGNGRITRQELDEFSFYKHEPAPPRAAAECEYEAISDYHSTLDELEVNPSRTSPRHVHDVLTTTRPPPRPEVEQVEKDPCYDEITARRRRNSSGSSDAFGGDQQQGLVPVATPGPARRRTYPLLNSPYVVCQHCYKVLQVPRDLPPRSSAIQKLRCGACQSISKFSVAIADDQRRQRQSLDIVPSTSFSDDVSISSPASGCSIMSGRNERAATPSSKAAGGKKVDESSVDDDCKSLNAARNTNLVAMVSSSARGSPAAASAPASFHHTAYHRHQSGGGTNNKGYESAPEFHHDALSSSSHARTVSAGSSTTAPVAPCLHELFGYESPSHFVKVADNKVVDIAKPRPAAAGGFKGLLSKLQLHHSHNDTAVSINGRTLPDDVVRRAEEQAGPIHPGSYWYDYRAGFWGLMGGPCIGIVPPFIDEFKHLGMPVNCAGGKSGVVVNGRELHHQDLQLLIKRGLPPTPNAAYTIDIDGLVADAATGNEIKCLGRLAPSIEKRGVGFGMYPLSSRLT